jgi:hypothetical protein
MARVVRAVKRRVTRPRLYAAGAMPSQNRLELTRALDQHDQRDASTLVARQFTPSITTSQVFPDLKDSALIDATAGAVNVTLPAGSEEIIGLPWYARKTDVSANAAGLLCAGSDTFADTTTSLTTTTQGAEVGAMWDGTYWRPLPSSGGAVSVAAVTTTGSITAGTTMAAGTGASIGGAGAGTAAAWYTSNKTAGGVGGVMLKEANAKRATAGLDASENYVIEVFTGAAGAEVSGGSVTISPTGTVTLTGALNFTLASVRAAADDAAAAALVPAVPVGGLYRTASALKIREA